MIRRRIDPSAKRRIEELLAVGYGPTSIIRQLEEDPALRDRVPSLRTVESMAAEIRGQEPAVTWTVGESDPDEAALVLPVLAELIAAGQVTSLTKETARWVAVIRRIAPALPTVEVLVLAGRYQAATRAGASTHDIDVELARHIARRPPG